MKTIIIALLFTSAFAQLAERKECKEQLKTCLKEKMEEKMEDFRDDMEECRIAGRCTSPVCVSKAIRAALNDDCGLDLPEKDNEGMYGKRMMKKLFGGRKGRGFGGRKRNKGMKKHDKKMDKLQDKMLKKAETFCEEPEAFTECAEPKIMAKLAELKSNLEEEMENMEPRGRGRRGGRGGKRGGRRGGRRGGKKGGLKKLMAALGDEADACKEELSSECAELIESKPTSEEKAERKEGRTERREAKKEKREEKQKKREAKCECLGSIDMADLEDAVEEECGSLPGDLDLAELIESKKERACKSKKDNSRRRRPRPNSFF